MSTGKFKDQHATKEKSTGWCSLAKRRLVLRSANGTIEASKEKILFPVVT